MKQPNWATSILFVSLFLFSCQEDEERIFDNSEYFVSLEMTETVAGNMDFSAGQGILIPKEKKIKKLNPLSMIMRKPFFISSTLNKEGL